MSEPKPTVETELWSGTYSTKALALAWIGAAVLFVSFTVVALCVAETWTQVLIASGVVALPMLYVYLLGAYRRFTIRYRLTNSRMIVESGLLTAAVDRVALLVVDDIYSRQGGLDRMFGIGTITVLSRDKTDPTLTLRGVENVREVALTLEQAVANERQSHGSVISA